MTSALHEEDSKVARMKHKPAKDHVKDETRSFLSYSNLNISDMEQGFNKRRLLPNRNTTLSVVALLISLLCLAFEAWKFHCSLVNTREIEELKQNVETLAYRLSLRELQDEVKPFEKKLYDAEELESDNTDYYSDYDRDDWSRALPPDHTFISREEMTEFIAKLKEELWAKINKSVDSDSDSIKSPPLDLRSNTTSKNKRSIVEEDHGPRKLLGRHFHRRKTRRMLTSDSSSRETLESGSVEKQNATTSVTVPSRHPPKKYHTPPPKDTTDASFDVQSVTSRPRKVSRKLRKTMNQSRKLVAIHYDGDPQRYNSETDVYDANGRIRHGSSNFKAWKPSDWVNDLGMNQYFRMADDGSVTVYETGLYLVYAQIHYNDDHDQIGFHLQVNNQPILQCLIDNSGHLRNMSQTCFSAQLTPLQKEDVLVFKEASSPRFAIFDKMHSFFGLVKLAELRRPTHRTQ